MKLTSLLLLFAAPATLMGQEVFELKFKRDAGHGGVTQVEKRETTKARSKLIAVNAKETVEDNQQSKIVVYEYRETVLAKALGDKEPSRLRRQYKVHYAKEGDKTTTLPLQGKTVIIEKKDEKYRFRFEDGAELSPREAEDLTEEFQNPGKPRLDLDELLTKDFVQVQHMYKINPKLLVKVFAPMLGPTMIEENQPKGDYTLKRAYKKDGRQYGELEVRIYIPVQELTSIAGKSTRERLLMAPGASMRIRLTADGCIDGSAVDKTVKTNLSVEGTGLIPRRDNPMFQLLLSVEAASDVTMEEVKARP